MYGVDFQGREEEALELLMQIDSCRQVRTIEPELEIKISRFKGTHELKSLITFDVKFKSSGNGNMGKDLTISEL